MTTRLGGILLAIELAAARVISLTPEEIAGRLGDRIESSIVDAVTTRRAIAACAP